MSLPKTLSDSLVKKLNKACDIFSQICDVSCNDLGWCETCWIMVGGKDGDEDDYEQA